MVLMIPLWSIFYIYHREYTYLQSYLPPSVAKILIYISFEI